MNLERSRWQKGKEVPVPIVSEHTVVPAHTFSLIPSFILVPQVAIYFKLTTRPSIGVSHVVLILWQLTQERLLGTIFPEFLLADSSCLQSLHLKVSLSGFIIYGSYFSLLEHLKYVIPLSPYTKCCCQKSHEHRISFPFLSDEVILPGSPTYFLEYFTIGHSGSFFLGTWCFFSVCDIKPFFFNSTKLDLDCPIISIPLLCFALLFVWILVSMLFFT